MNRNFSCLSLVIDPISISEAEENLKIGIEEVEAKALIEKEVEEVDHIVPDLALVLVPGLVLIHMIEGHVHGLMTVEGHDHVIGRKGPSIEVCFYKFTYMLYYIGQEINTKLMH